MRKFVCIALVGLLTTACTTVATTGNGNEIILLGESRATGDDATAQANLKLRNAQAAGCYGIAVGGYAVAAPEQGVVYGIPFMVRCPAGVNLIPNGTRAP